MKPYRGAQAALLLVAMAFLGAACSTPSIKAASRTVASSGSPDCPDATDWSDASSVEGQRATIEGPVRSVRYEPSTRGEPTFLNIGTDYPDPSRFTAVIWGENRDNFSPVPDNSYDGKTICVTGMVTTYAGVPQIEVSSPSQITMAPVSTTTTSVDTSTTATSTTAALGESVITRSPPNHAYTVALPGSWVFRDISYPSDHSTHLWYDPADPLRKLDVVMSGCVGCTEDPQTGQLNVRGLVPQNATSSFIMSEWKAGYLKYDTDNPYPDNGIVIITPERSTQPGGYVQADLWLPEGEHSEASQVLNRFAVNPLPWGS